MTIKSLVGQSLKYLELSEVSRSTCTVKYKCLFVSLLVPSLPSGFFWLEEFLVTQWRDDCWHPWTSNASEQLPSSPIERYQLYLYGLALLWAQGTAMETTNDRFFALSRFSIPGASTSLRCRVENNPYATLTFSGRTRKELTSNLGLWNFSEISQKSWLYKTPLKYSHQMFAMHITLALYVVRWISIISCFSHLQRWLFQPCPDVARWA